MSFNMLRGYKQVGYGGMVVSYMNFTRGNGKINTYNIKNILLQKDIFTRQFPKNNNSRVKQGTLAIWTKFVKNQ